MVEALEYLDAAHFPFAASGGARHATDDIFRNSNASVKTDGKQIYIILEVLISLLTSIIL